MTASQQTSNLQFAFTPMKSLLEQHDRWLSTVMESQQKMLQLQVELLADTISDSLPVLAPPLNVDGMMGAPWRLAMLYPSLAEHVADGIRHGYEVMAQTQGAILGQACDAFVSLGQRASAAQSQVNGLVIDRRVSAQLINFENRRKAVETVSPASASNSEPDEGSSRAQSPRRQAAQRSAA